MVYEDKAKLDKLLKAGQTVERPKTLWIFLPSVQALAERNDAKPPRVKAFVAYGYTPAEGLRTQRSELRYWVS